MDTSLFERYQAELEEELKLDEFTLKDSQLKLPSNRHKWVARLIKQKIELSKLQKLRKKAIGEIGEKIRQDEPITLSDIAIKKHAERHEIIQKIDDEIEMCEILISYLDKVVEKVSRGISYDIKNLIELKQLETT